MLRRKTIAVFFAVLSCLFLLTIFPKSTYAHPFNYGAVKTTLAIKQNQILLRTEAPQKIQFNSTDNAGQQQIATQYFADNLKIFVNSRACTFTLNSFNFAASNKTIFNGKFVCPISITDFRDLTIHSQMFLGYFANIDHFMNVSLQGKQINLIFNQANQDYPQNVKPVPKTAIGRFVAVEKQFIWLGIKHIWTGYDHILFLVSIVLLLRSLKEIIILVSSFTVAHSITLILAGLGILTISPRIVEPLIAVTIIYTALRNGQILLHKKWKVNVGERRVTTMSFGLIHGLGFAGALLATSVPNDYFIPSLLFFNVGVEIGQLGILLIIIPILFMIYRQQEKREILLTITIITVLLSSFWLVQRVFFY
jgi:hydrogenase/urease accessory protein HupE